jgi:hypothetical protein
MILVPMQMPKNCAECPLAEEHGLSLKCFVMDYDEWATWALGPCSDEECGAQRHPDCPLREVEAP